MPTSYLTPLLRHVKRRPWCYKTTKNKKEVSRKSPPCNDWLLPTETSASSIHPGELSPAVAASPAQDFRFARNVLTTSLRAIGAASCSLPIGALLSVVIEPLLLIMDQVDEMSGNAREVIRLAEQIDRLKPIVADVDFGEQSADTAMALQRELRSIKDDIAKAQVQGKLARFFNSTDDAFSLARHNANLTNLIAESTLATVREMRSSVYGIERSLSSLTPERSNSSLESSNFFLTGPEGRPGLGDITVRTSGYDIVRCRREFMFPSRWFR